VLHACHQLARVRQVHTVEEEDVNMISSIDSGSGSGSADKATAMARAPIADSTS
jgi:hypothetical protein